MTMTINAFYSSRLCALAVKKQIQLFNLYKVIFKS